jgi:hypothetical protein
MKAIAIVFATTIAACATTSSPGSPQVEAISAEPSAFTAYRTFAFRPAGEPPFPYRVSARSFEVERRMHTLVATALAHKGYREAGTSPDL